MQKLGNTSTAVMQRRHEPADSLDDYPTPPFSTRSIIHEVLKPRGVDLGALTILEPACNRGYMARPLAETGARVITSDIADYGWTGQQLIGDFLRGRYHDLATGEEAEIGPVDWVFTNPPFVLAADFILRALAVARVGVAIIVRNAFLEGGDRYLDLFSKAMPWLVAQHVERVPMVRGRFDPDASSATAYSWIIFRRDWKADHYIGTWVPKCRDRYERPDDVNFDLRSGAQADFVSQAIADSPLFAHGGR